MSPKSLLDGDSVSTFHLLEDLDCSEEYWSGILYIISRQSLTPCFWKDSSVFGRKTTKQRVILLTPHPGYMLSTWFITVMLTLIT